MSIICCKKRFLSHGSTLPCSLLKWQYFSMTAFLSVLNLFHFTDFCCSMTCDLSSYSCSFWYSFRIARLRTAFSMDDYFLSGPFHLMPPIRLNNLIFKPLLFSGVLLLAVVFKSVEHFESVYSTILSLKLLMDTLLL